MSYFNVHMCIPSVRLPIVLPFVLPTRIVLLVLLPLELQLDVYKKYVLRLNEYTGVEGESGVLCCVALCRVVMGRCVRLRTLPTLANVQHKCEQIAGVSYVRLREPPGISSLPLLGIALGVPPFLSEPTPPPPLRSHALEEMPKRYV